MKHLHILPIIFSLLISVEIQAQENPEIQFPFENATDFYLSADASKLFVPEKNEISIISMAERKIIDKIQTQHQANITAIAVSSDGKYILTGDKEGEIHLYYEEGSLVKNFDIHTSTIYTLEFHPTEAKFISSSKDGKLLVTKYLSDSEPVVLHTSKKPVYCATFSVDGSLISAGFNNGMVRVYDSKAHTEIYSKKVQSKTVRSIANHSTNKKLFIAGDNSLLKLWNFETNNVATIKAPNNYKDWILSIDSDTNNTFLSYGNYRGSIYTIIMDLAYTTNYRKPVLKLKAIRYADSQIENIALIKGLGIAFIPVDKMFLPKKEGAHRPTQFYLTR